MIVVDSCLRFVCSFFFSFFAQSGCYSDQQVWESGQKIQLTQLVEHLTTMREVAGSNPGQTNTQGL